MSEFSGKCDFYDGFVAIHSDGDEEKVKENLKKLKLYVLGDDGRDHLVKSDTIADIAKYYPYLESIACFGEDSISIFLSSDSFIDQEEKYFVGMKVDSVLKYWRKCKRNKKPFNKQECIDACYWRDDDNLEAIIDKVAEYGEKAQFDDIHLPLHEYYRTKWFDELIRLGYSEFDAYRWCFKDWDMVKKRLKKD